MAKKRQKTPRSARATRAERHPGRKKDKKGKGSEKEPASSLKEQVGGGKGAPKVGQELSKPQNSRPQPRAKRKKAKESR